MAHRGAPAQAVGGSVLPATRALSIVIVPFLVTAFVVLYVFPAHTDRWFAWEITAPMTAMMLGAVYLGGAYFFVRAASATDWHSLKAGFVAVGTFASVMGVATILHWDRFSHGHVAFWLWAALYFTTPFLVWGVWALNHRAARSPRADDVVLPTLARAGIAGTGGLAVVTGLFLFIWPAQAIAVWPWEITPLTSRTLGAIFLLGIAGLGVITDPRWRAARLMLQVEAFMLALILIAAARAHAEFDAGNALTWLLLGGLLATLVGAVAVTVRMADRAR
jgi:hypothetical protein